MWFPETPDRSDLVGGFVVVGHTNSLRASGSAVALAVGRVGGPVWGVWGLAGAFVVVPGVLGWWAVTRRGRAGLVLSGSAGAAGAGHLVDGSVIDKFTQVCLPGFLDAADGVPGVQPGQVASDEGDGQQEGGGGDHDGHLREVLESLAITT